MAARIDVVLVLFAIESVAAAQTSSERLTLIVGESVEIDVGHKIGFACDDTRILRASMVTRGQHNAFIVEGLAAGTTLCRVGTDPTLPSYLLEVVIEDASVRVPGRRGATR